MQFQGNLSCAEMSFVRVAGLARKTGKEGA